MAGKNFDAFKLTIEREFMGHPVVKKNDYTAWFAHGDVPMDHLRQFTVQFSVFSNQFLLDALNRVINADTLAASREAKEILMNELGVIYNKPASGFGLQSSAIPQTAGSGSGTSRAMPEVEREGDPALVSTEGTVDGGKFRF